MQPTFYKHTHFTCQSASLPARQLWFVGGGSGDFTMLPDYPQLCPSRRGHSSLRLDVFVGLDQSWRMVGSSLDGWMSRSSNIRDGVLHHLVSVVHRLHPTHKIDSVSSKHTTDTQPSLANTPLPISVRTRKRCIRGYLIDCCVVCGCSSAFSWFIPTDKLTDRPTTCTLALASCGALSRLLVSSREASTSGSSLLLRSSLVAVAKHASQPTNLVSNSSRICFTRFEPRMPRLPTADCSGPQHKQTSQWTSRRVR